MEDEHTNFIGRVTDGRQFWGYQTFVFKRPYSEINKEEWQQNRLEYLVLHTFDKTGNYLSSKHWFAGTTDQADQEKMYSKLEEWVEELGDIEFADIEVKLFQVTIDGITFGLVPDKETESIELQPSSTISFQEPWDGEYYT